MQSIKLFNRQADRQARFMNLVVDAMNADIATRKLELMFSVLHRLLFGLERVAVIWVGALLVMDQRSRSACCSRSSPTRSSSRSASAR